MRQADLASSPHGGLYAAASVFRTPTLCSRGVRRAEREIQVDQPPGDHPEHRLELAEGRIDADVDGLGGARLPERKEAFRQAPGARRRLADPAEELAILG